MGVAVDQGRVAQGVSRTIKVLVATVALSTIATAITWASVDDDQPDAPRPLAAEAPVAPVPAVPAPAPDAQPEPARPTSVTPAVVGRGAPLARRDLAAGSVQDIPDPAFVAYQRSAAIIGAAVECRLDWSVLAAIGRVESDHGRGAKGDHRLGRAGRERPAPLVGAPLDGKQGRGRVPDTDGGALDGNARWDAPLGPMGLLATTWARVAVDGDGDDVRSPQDVDDAALGAAVLLCADGHDLSRRAALRRALTNYHDAPGFVGAVLAIARSYREQGLAPPPEGLLPSLPVDLPDPCPCVEAVRAVAKEHSATRPEAAHQPVRGEDRGADRKPSAAKQSARPPVPAAPPATPPAGPPPDPVVPPTGHEQCQPPGETTPGAEPDIPVEGCGNGPAAPPPEPPDDAPTDTAGDTPDGTPAEAPVDAVAGTTPATAPEE